MAAYRKFVLLLLLVCVADLLPFALCATPSPIIFCKYNLLLHCIKHT